MPSNEAPAKTRFREPDTGREAVIDPWLAAAGEYATEQSGWLLSYLDVMTLLFSFFVMLFAYQKALTVESKTARAGTMATMANNTAPIANDGSNRKQSSREHPDDPSGSAGAALPIANGRPGSARTTLPIPVSPAVIKASKTVSTNRTSAPLPAQNAADRTSKAQAEIKVQPAYPMEMLAVASVFRSESEVHVKATSPAQKAAETSNRAESSDKPFPPVSEKGWIAEAGDTTGSAAISLSKAFSDADLGSSVEISAASGEVRLEINDAILFDPASAELKPEGANVLDRLASVLGAQGGTLAVEGHTDDRPIATPRYRSNWDLSTARASTVTRYLIAHGVSPERLRAVGLADTQPREANATPEGRARNRRVSIVMFLARKDDVKT